MGDFEFADGRARGLQAAAGQSIRDILVSDLCAGLYFGYPAAAGGEAGGRSRVAVFSKTNRPGLVPVALAYYDIAVGDFGEVLFACEFRAMDSLVAFFEFPYAGAPRGFHIRRHLKSPRGGHG